jgi:hypothetical protein
MRRGVKYLTALAAVAMMSLPVWARPDSTTLVVDTPTQIGATQLEPGQYQLQAKPNADHLTVYRDGKAVAEVPVHWIQKDKKAEQSQILMSDNRVTEVDFSGKTQAIQITAH